MSAAVAAAAVPEEEGDKRTTAKVDMDDLQSYKVEQCISKTAVSEVYKATHLDSGESVAIRRIKIFDLQPAMRKECEMEVSLLQTLDHPYLVKYFTHFVNAGDLFVVMEHPPGGSLAQLVQSTMKSGRFLEECLLWNWASDLASALVYLHRRRVLHRDVKPSHVFLSDGQKAKLGDFGLSKAMSTNTACAFSCVGTPFYMSPEIVKGNGYSFGSDVWSLGCSLYELAMGHPPFYRKDKDFYALGAAICSARYPALPSEAWSRAYAELVGDILVVDPTQRPDAQHVLDAAGRHLLKPGGEEVTAETGRRMQDFEILGTLGHGKFSEVHRSLWHAGGKQPVALKRIKIFDMDTRARRECNDEVNILKSFDHSTIIRYLDSFTEGSELVIVLELAAHGDLANLCAQLKQDARTLAELQIWAIFLQVSDALCHMHEKRIMHRDIKPANIFVCDAGVVKLGDLGLGRYFSSKTYRAHSVVGTPFYMSPEVITNSDGYSFKSDIWSLGCVLYELAVLSSPFHSSRLNYYALGNQICRGEYPPLPDRISARVRSLCSSMIQVKCDSRPDAAAVLSATRRHFAQGGDEDLQWQLVRAASAVGEMLELSPAGARSAAAPAVTSQAAASAAAPQAAAQAPTTTPAPVQASATPATTVPSAAAAAAAAAVTAGVAAAVAAGPAVQVPTAPAAPRPGGGYASARGERPPPHGSASARRAGPTAVGAGAAVAPLPLAQSHISTRVAGTSRGRGGGSLSARGSSREREARAALLGVYASAGNTSLGSTGGGVGGNGSRRAPSPSSQVSTVSPLRVAGQLAGGTHSEGWRNGAPPHTSRGLPPIIQRPREPFEAFVSDGSAGNSARVSGGPYPCRRALSRGAAS